VLAFTPSPFDYGQVAVGQTATETFTLTNSGGKASGKVTFTLPGSAEFTITATTCPGLGVGPGMTCMVTVQFAPTSLGTVTATLTATGQHATATDSLTGTSVVHLYWTDSGAGTVNVINLPSTTVQTLVSGQNVPAGLAVDSSHLYWTNAFGGTINRANPDGTGVTTLVSGQGGPVGVAVDSSHLFWANQGAGTIMEANLDGTGVTTLVSGQSGPFGVAVDSSHLYWTNQGNGTVAEASLDGTGVTTLVSGQNGPAGVAVSP
jgi:hypothetical protein